MLNRRQLMGALTAAVAGGLTLAGRRSPAAQSTQRSGLGMCIYCLGLQRRWRKQRDDGPDLFDPVTFLDYCHGLGAGGVQVPLGIKDQAYTADLRRRAEKWGMFLEGIGGLPRDQNSLERFDAEVRTAQQAGARAIRVVIIPGRRYEQFNSAEEFRRFAEAGRRSLELAEPVAARHKMPLAVENHKDQRIPARLALLKHISSEWVGACVDTGNSISLLEDPTEVVEAYAPWARSVHLKDQAVQEYEDGFLLADVPLGDGFLDLSKMVTILRKARPDVCFSFEGITRDPLKVPCLTEKYWATFADVPGRDLARTLRMVRAAAPDEPLPRVSHLTLDEQVRQEEDNVKKSLAFARKHLGL
jgi:sugar phosphate isomerase/epimerase